MPVSIRGAVGDRIGRNEDEKESPDRQKHDRESTTEEVIHGFVLAARRRAIKPPFSGILNRSLRFLHHGHGSDQNNRRDDLMRTKRGVKETPGDANSSESLHHFKITGGRGSRQAQTFEVE